MVSKFFAGQDSPRAGLVSLAIFLILLGSGSLSAQAPVSGLIRRLPARQALTAPARPRLLPLDTFRARVAAPTFTLVGVGDMMLGTNYPSPDHLPPNEGKELLLEVADILQDADLTFGNLEGTILDEGGTPKTCKNPDACYVFRSPESYVRHFVDAGFDLLSLANNHSGDFGAEGRQRTKELLREAGIAFAGLAGTDEVAVVERAGLRFGFCAFAPNSGTCDIRDTARARSIIAALAAQVDIVVVSFHGGAEGPSNQNVPRATEVFYGEDRGNVYEFAHAVVDAGADIVFGHGPHVTRAAELYQDRFIIYSLGNFCTYGRFNLTGPAGIAPIVRLTIDPEGAFVGGEIIPVFQKPMNGPKIDPERRALHKLIELSETDFPESVLLIRPDGTLSRRPAEPTAELSDN